MVYVQSYNDKKGIVNLKVRKWLKGVGKFILDKGWLGGGGSTLFYLNILKAISEKQVLSYSNG